jgi:trans-aconitate 2-methyltransferase
MPVREWDGASYDRISSTMEAFGLDVLERLELRGDETVLDAGCGSGRITQALIERLPRGHVIAVDESPSMIDAARLRLGPDADLRVADLLALELSEPVDAILSTATFHWIADHQRLFARLRAALRPGGRLVAQCGGEGNIEILRATAREVRDRAPYAQHFQGWQPPWNYAGPEDTRKRLLAGGFAQAECWLTPAPRQPDHAREFLSTVVLGPYVQQLPEELRERYMDEVLAALGASPRPGSSPQGEAKPVTVDYVRLNIDATA